MNRIQSIRRAVSNPTLSDSVDIGREVTRSVLCNAAGTVRVTLADAADGTFVDYVFNSAQRHPISIKRIFSTGTTVAAASIVLEF